MEKELNIVAILKDKPKGIKLWTDIFGEVTLDSVSKNGNGFNVKHHHGVLDKFLPNGKIYEEGALCIYPSKSMRDWSKFACKKGDVLQYENGGGGAIFMGWSDDSYTHFESSFFRDWRGVGIGKKMHTFKTEDFEKADETTVNFIIDGINEYSDGKFNLSTLTIEKPKPQFKDGDIIKHGKNIYIVQSFTDSYVHIYAGLVGNTGEAITRRLGISSNFGCSNLATDSEKQQLFSALEERGKRWNAETKTLEDLPKKYKFKTMDYFLARYNYSKDALWNLYQYAFTDKDGYIFAVNECCIEADKHTCIPYNEETAHLLGTTDDWKGGEG